MKVGFVSLGCSKNLVDTEMMIGLFKKNNFKIVNNPKEAEIIVINTCGFIGPAKEEAINTILEMAEYKKAKCKFLIVMGCLVERYKKDLEKITFNKESKKTKVIKNIDGTFYSEKDNMVETLSNHIVSPVRFDKTIRLMEQN